MKAWYSELGAESDVVVSSRIRLARNIANMPFSKYLSDEQAKKRNDSVKGVLFDSALSSKLEYFDLDTLDAIYKRSFVEEHMMSPQMLDGRQKALILSKDRQTSIMLGEEDHIRLQVIKAGLSLKDCYDAADKLDNLINERVDYAFSEELGYLTHCPTNVGTGLRASVMMHLPALKMAGQINSLIGAVGKLGITVRGFYGEGSEAGGDFYQISNQITLGISETETIEKIFSVSEQIIEQERDLRSKIHKQMGYKLVDSIMRAYGVLAYAYSISSNEVKKLLSQVRMGITLGIIKEADLITVGSLMVACEPAHILQKYGQQLSPQLRDQKRAELIRNQLGLKKS